MVRSMLFPLVLLKCDNKVVQITNNFIAHKIIWVTSYLIKIIVAICCG